MTAIQRQRGLSSITIQTYGLDSTKGYGYAQELIPLPLADGRIRFVPVLGEAW